eukprot:scaffold262917_cov30-Tisochrysis_lutea.AAC.4
MGAAQKPLYAWRQGMGGGGGVSSRAGQAKRGRGSARSRPARPPTTKGLVKLMSFQRLAPPSQKVEDRDDRDKKRG